MYVILCVWILACLFSTSQRACLQVFYHYKYDELTFQSLIDLRLWRQLTATTSSVKFKMHFPGTVVRQRSCRSVFPHKADSVNCTEGTKYYVARNRKEMSSLDDNLWLCDLVIYDMMILAYKIKTHLGHVRCRLESTSRSKGRRRSEKFVTWGRG